MTSRSVAAPKGPITTTWGYDTNANDRRLVSINNSGVTRSYALGYKSAGVTNPYDILSITDTAAAGHPFASQTHAYGYDQADRVQSATASVTGNFGFGYDGVDNLSTLTTPSGTTNASYNALNEISTFGTNGFVYDANGKPLSGDGQRTYKWDAENRLIEIDYVGTQNKSQFAYDGLGRMTVDSETLNGAVGQTRYLWCGGRICQSRDAADAVARRDFDEGELNVGQGVPLVHMPDHLGSSRDVLNATTGAVVAAFDFAPNGAAVQSSGTTAVDYKFARLLGIPGSGLNMAMFRFQDPTTNRWLNRDPAREDGGGANLYAYARGGLMQRIDPLGLYDFCDFSIDALHAWAGFSDEVTFGVSKWARGVLNIEYADTCSLAYRGGTAGGIALEMGLAGYGIFRRSQSTQR